MAPTNHISYSSFTRLSRPPAGSSRISQHCSELIPDRPGQGKSLIQLKYSRYSERKIPISSRSFPPLSNPLLYRTERLTCSSPPTTTIHAKLCLVQANSPSSACVNRPASLLPLNNSALSSFAFTSQASSLPAFPRPQPTPQSPICARTTIANWCACSGASGISIHPPSVNRQLSLLFLLFCASSFIQSPTTRVFKFSGFPVFRRAHVDFSSASCSSLLNPVASIARDLQNEVANAPAV
ncbi:uncharacterized protein FOMMEDRAFT_157354 [Fomitiporia mediterranea MF3/22]|uniref:uncharacterized protein n=1 Tax=Fomitiporia mediterranea (strain MF3/22) TaxID=694068 RepID=UPI00044087B3|nr:uncharacterized protein FOMMEDRAFT_157354 [Fomitiporia mediterranea MF3/22]EJD02159.1 hypothetical protein FOMMEDRAFT_157354 [Fomitiporia mediterranea MF3/22]